MPVSGFVPSRLALMVAGMVTLAASAAAAQTMIVGNDEKAGMNDKGAAIVNPPGHDSLSILDISTPQAPKITATIPLMNTIVGPPTNLAIVPSGAIALVANSVKPSVKGWDQQLVSDNRVFVVDLKASPPAIIATVTTGKKPSGLAISPDGKLALVCNRDDGTISVLSIDGKTVKVVGTVTVGTPADQVSAVAIAPDGKRALAAELIANKIAVMTIDGDKVTHTHDIPAGINPYNVAITPNGALALTADNGNHGTSDGNVDTVSVIDLAANPPRVINRVTVGDSPEGLAISPKGNLAVAVEARGSNQPKTTWYYHPAGAISVLRIDGKTVSKVGEVTVGALPEGAVFSPDGGTLYVGNFIDQDLSVLKVDGDKVTDTGQRFKLPGHPASMRGGPQ